jgi:hypothetical protein
MTHPSDPSPPGENCWQPIDTAPKDGSWFLICHASEGFGSYEVGRYDPWKRKNYDPVGHGLFREVEEVVMEWSGFNNFHRATHWMPLPVPPNT